jgi:Sec-independent protein translocase protein TatA
MGSLELVVILLVGFIILGPKRMADAARLLGKATREVRRITEDLPNMILDENPEEPGKGRGGYRGGGRSGSIVEADTKEEVPEHGGPVAFRSDSGQGDSPGPQPLAEHEPGERPDQPGPADGPSRQNGDKPRPPDSREGS